MAIKQGIVGVISDTHGLVRPEAMTALKGVELIIHGGDIGNVEVLHSLGSIAPVCAIRGNNDHDPGPGSCRIFSNLQINGVRLYVIHNVNELEVYPSAAGIHAVISGHSHQPGKVKYGDVLFVNPGSAGPRRFKLPVTVGKLRLRHQGNGRGRNNRFKNLTFNSLTFSRAQVKNS